jgi:hypothetical protein
MRKNSGAPTCLWSTLSSDTTGGSGGAITWLLLTRIIHEAFTAAADPGMPAALRSVGFLDVLSSTPAESFRRAPCIHARLRRLATNLHE